MEFGSSKRFAPVSGTPLLGSLLPIRRDPLSFFSRVLKEHGDRVQLRVLGRSIRLLSHPDDIEQVLIRDRDSYGRSAEIRKLRPIFGRGLLASEGGLWRRQRQLIQPSFQHDALATYCQAMLSTIRAQIASWREGDVIDIHAEMMRYTRDTICRVLFGDHDVAAQNGIGEAVTTVFGDLRSEILYLPLWRRLPTTRSRNWNRAVELLNDAVGKVIANRRRDQSEQEDFLGALLRARGPRGESMSDEQVHDEVLTFFLAGHETAALSLTWACYLLAGHPEAQEALRDEVEALGSGRILPAEYGKLRGLNAVLKEALRLYPPVWSMGREVTADTTLGGEPMQKGTDIWICLHRLHRDERWFKQPDRFLPERWLREDTPRPFTYMPFGLGPRVCIGQHFATAESVLGLGSMLSRFRLELTRRDAVEPSAWITLRPKQRIMLRLANPNA